MNFDNYVINDGDKDIIIYPILEIKVKDELYIIYTDKIKNNYTKEDLIVGEMTDEEILPVPENLLSQFDGLIDEIIDINNK